MIHQDLQPLVWRNDYVIDDMIAAMQRVGIQLGQQATVFLAMGHVPLARRLRQMGIQPGPCAQATISMARGMDVLAIMTHPVNYRQRVQHGVGGQVVMPSQVLEYLIHEDTTWPIEVNAVHGDRTPFMTMLHCFADGKPEFEVDTLRCLDLLVRLGADPLLTTHHRTSVAAAATAYQMGMPYDHYRELSRGEQQARKLAHRSRMVDKVLALGADIEEEPHMALARALVGHVTMNPAGYTEQHPFPPEFEMLFSKGLPFSCPTVCHRKNNLFAIAVEHGAVGTVKALLEAGADPAWADHSKGDTLFSVAGEAGSQAATKALRAIPPTQLLPVAHMTDAKGNTPLHRAVAAMMPGVVEHLLATGVDPNIPNNKGQLPYEVVRRTGAKAQRNLAQIAQMLEAAGGKLSSEDADPTGLLRHACKALSADMTQQWLDRGGEVNGRDGDGRTPLYLAIEGLTTVFAEGKRKKSVAAQSQLVQVLLAAGADPNLPDRHGNTPLHIAIKRFQEDSARLLLEGGADIDARNEAGQAPAHLYAFSGYGGEAEVKMAAGTVRVLGERGIDWMEPDPVSGALPFASLRDMPELQSMIEQFQLLRATPQAPSKRPSKRL